MVDEREREDDVERSRHEGRVHRWSRSGLAWPGHTTFVAIKGDEVVVGDRYARDGIERSYACELQALLDGCFAELVAAQLGPRVLEELVAEVRRELGSRAPSGSPGGTPKLKTAPQPEVRRRPVEPPQRVEAVVPTAVVSAPSKAEDAARIDVIVVACAVASLPLAVALRGITRAPMHDLLVMLRSLPKTVLAGASRVEAERARECLVELGATVELEPIRA